MIMYFEESDSESVCSSSTCSLDDEETNIRVRPAWCSYRGLLESRGFRLDTNRDVKQFYQIYLQGVAAAGRSPEELAGYARALKGDDDELCKDAGLPEQLFRGTQCKDGTKVVIKAAHLLSREYQIVQYLTRSDIRQHKMNHCIPILALIEVPQDQLVFIVMEEWSPLWQCELQCTLFDLLEVFRQCIEHTVFLHSHHIAHLDITLRNVLTDCNGHYAFIDYETSHVFESSASRIRSVRTSEIPPEVEREEWADPYKIDVWALGVLMAQALKTIHDVPAEMEHVARLMLNDNHEKRPTAEQVSFMFEAVVEAIKKTSTCSIQEEVGG